jgi:hypothetical protein
MLSVRILTAACHSRQWETIGMIGHLTNCRIVSQFCLCLSTSVSCLSIGIFGFLTARFTIAHIDADEIVSHLVQGSPRISAKMPRREEVTSPMFA